MTDSLTAEQEEELYLYFMQHMLILGYVPENEVEDIAGTYLDVINQVMKETN